MRLNPTEIAAIERAARETFAPRSTIRLFGSRPDDSRRGGDIDLIDLLVEPPAPLSPQELVERRHRFIARLYRLLGERSIDVLIAPAGVPDDHPHRSPRRSSAGQGPRMTAQNLLATALWEADRHLDTLESALRD